MVECVVINDGGIGLIEENVESNSFPDLLLILLSSVFVEHSLILF